jgi:hypothetical protein
VLRGIEEARLGIGVLLLPARDGVAGRVVELSVDLGAEPESSQTALHFATVHLAQADPIFSSPVRHVGEGRRVDGRRRLARGGVQTRLSRMRAGNESDDRHYEDQRTHGPLPIASQRSSFAFVRRPHIDRYAAVHDRPQMPNHPKITNSLHGPARKPKQKDRLEAVSLFYSPDRIESQATRTPRPPI